MDYKYIEQLLDRYWECHTSEEEEQILRSFFAQKDVPAHLAQYASLFTFVKEAQEEHVSADFDKRFADILAEDALRHDTVRTHARTIPFRRRIALSKRKEPPLLSLPTPTSAPSEWLRWCHLSIQRMRQPPSCSPTPWLAHRWVLTFR